MHVAPVPLQRLHHILRWSREVVPAFSGHRRTWHPNLLSEKEESLGAASQGVLPLYRPCLFLSSIIWSWKRQTLPAENGGSVAFTVA